MQVKDVVKSPEETAVRYNYTSDFENEPTHRLFGKKSKENAFGKQILTGIYLWFSIFSLVEIVYLSAIVPKSKKTGLIFIKGYTHVAFKEQYIFF